MFSSSFTMSEQEHRQWTPYKHVVPPPTADAPACHALPPAPLAHLEICARLSSSFVREPRGKSCAGMKAKTKHALPQERKRAKGEIGYATQV
jgi:hypothetical protein